MPPKKPRRARQTPLTPERHAKLLKHEQFIHEMASSDVGRELGKAHLAKYGHEPDPSLNQPNAHAAPPIPPKTPLKAASMAAPQSKPATPKPNTPTPKTSSDRQPPRLANPAKILKDDGGQEYVMRGARRHTPPGGGASFSTEHRQKFNYANTAEMAKHVTDRKAARAAKLASRSQNPGFSTKQVGPSETKVSWEQKSETTAKPSVAAEHAKSVVHSASPSFGRAVAGFSNPAPVKQQNKPKPLTSEKQFTATKAVSQTHEKSFDTHANEAMAIANSSKSFDEHANEAMSVANSGRARPASQSARVSSRPSSASAPKSSSPAPEAPKTESRYVRLAPEREPKGAESSKQKYAISANVDPVIGLEPSRAKRQAVKTARKLDVAQQAHAGRAANRNKIVTKHEQVREASRRQGPLDRLVNGPKERPENPVGPVKLARVKAAARIGQSIDDKRLGKIESKYSKAKGHAESVHDEIRAGSRRGSRSDIGAVAGAAGRSIGSTAKGIAEGAAIIGKAEVKGVKNLVQAGRNYAEAKSIEKSQPGRSPESSAKVPHPSVSKRQFGKVDSGQDEL